MKKVYWKPILGDPGSEGVGGGGGFIGDGGTTIIDPYTGD